MLDEENGPGPCHSEQPGLMSISKIVPDGLTFNMYPCNSDALAI